MNVPAPGKNDQSEIVKAILNTADDIRTTMNYPYEETKYDYNLESFDNQDNKENNYVKIIFLAIIIILIGVVLFRLSYKWKK